MGLLCLSYKQKVVLQENRLKLNHSNNTKAFNIKMCNSYMCPRRKNLLVGSDIVRHRCFLVLFFFICLHPCHVTDKFLFVTQKNAVLFILNGKCR